MDLIQELERQRQTLLGFRNNPAISEEALSGALYELEQAWPPLLLAAMAENRPASARQRLADGHQEPRQHPRGVCGFDVPSYHYWQHQSAGSPETALLGWLEAFHAAWARACHRLAPAAQQWRRRAFGGARWGVSTDDERDRLADGSWILPAQSPFVPEISANKLALNIRFTRPDSEHRPRQCEGTVEVSFDIVFCAL